MGQYGNLAKRVTYVVGKDGKIVYIGEGAEAMDPAGAKNACLGPRVAAIRPARALRAASTRGWYSSTQVPLSVQDPREHGVALVVPAQRLDAPLREVRQHGVEVAHPARFTMNG